MNIVFLYVVLKSDCKYNIYNVEKLCFFLVRYNYDRSIKKYGDVDRLLCLFVLCVCLIGRLKKI